MDSESDTSPPDVVLYYDGLFHLENGRFVEALECFQQSWALVEHQGTANRIGQALQALNRREESHGWFARAYELNPRNNMMAMAHASSLHEQGHIQEAIKVLSALLKQNPTYKPARTLLAVLQP
jgi:tetratricopeptide (TPR) repeat protein